MNSFRKWGDREKLSSNRKKTKPRKPRVRAQKSEHPNPSEGSEETNQETGKDISKLTSAVREQKEEEVEKKNQKRKREDEEAEQSAKIKAKKKNKNKKQKKKDKKEEVGEDECDDSKNKIEPGNESVIEEHIKEKEITSVERADAKHSEQNPKTVYVGGIPYCSTEDDILSFFDSCGTITEVDCMIFPESGKFRELAILTFKTDAVAKRALALDGADMGGGFYMKIQPYKASQEQEKDFAPEPVEVYNRVYAGNLTWEITEDDLRKLFTDCRITSIRFGMDKETEEFKGYAHVDFADSE